MPRDPARDPRPRDRFRHSAGADDLHIARGVSVAAGAAARQVIVTLHEDGPVRWSLSRDQAAELAEQLLDVADLEVVESP